MELFFSKIANGLTVSRKLFSKKSSIVDFRLGSKYASDTKSLFHGISAKAYLGTYQTYPFLERDFFGKTVCFRSSHRRYSVKRAILENFAILTEKYLCWSLFLTKLQA